MPPSEQAWSSAGLDLGPRRSPVPALERRHPLLTRRHEQRVAAPRHAGPPREIGHERAASAPGTGRCRPAPPPRPAPGHLGHPPLDPGPQLADRRRRLSLRGAAGQHDLDPAHGVDGHPDSPCPVRAAHLVDDLFHGATEYGQRRRTWWTTFSTPQGYGPLRHERLPPPHRPADRRAVVAARLRRAGHSGDPDRLPGRSPAAPRSPASIVHRAGRSWAVAPSASPPPAPPASTRRSRSSSRVPTPAVGQIRVEAVDWDHARAELTIWLAPQARGRGLGRNALRLAGEWLLTTVRAGPRRAAGRARQRGGDPRRAGGRVRTRGRPARVSAQSAETASTWSSCP